MPKFTVEKSVSIAAPRGQVFALVRDFRKWEQWSPWLIAEPEVKPKYMENPDGYSWEGNITGVGEILLEREVPGESIACKLTFLKPWKSICAVNFEFKDAGEATQVTWRMDSSLPFFMFFMKGMMTTLIGMDYERGLNMLKDLAETGAVPSKLEFPGKTSAGGFGYVGLKSEGSTKDIGPLMEADMGRLGRWLQETGTVPAGKPFAIYHKWDPVKGMVRYTIGFPVSEVPVNLADGFESGEVPACDVYQIKHSGAYRHLGNAWSAGIMRSRAKLFRQGKQVHPFETYETDPTEVSGEIEIVTTVNFPMK